MEAVTPPLKTNHIRFILNDTEFIDYLLKVFHIESDDDTQRYYNSVHANEVHVRNILFFKSFIWYKMRAAKRMSSYNLNRFQEFTSIQRNETTGNVWICHMMMMKHKRANILLEVLVIPVDRCITSKVKSLQIRIPKMRGRCRLSRV